MMFFRVLSLWVITILTLYLHAGNCARIIGGQKVQLHSMPYMARLESSTGHLVCGGVLINASWVLTAAHCEDKKHWFSRRTISKVNLGVHNVTDKREKASSQLIDVKRHVPHPDYNSAENRHDIMLIQLKNPVKQTKTVRVMSPPKPIWDVTAGTECTVAGWGLTKEGDRNSESDILLYTKVTVIDRKLCNSPEYYNFFPIITGGMLCAGYQDRHPPADACQGDSGGPLVCDGELRGVVSFGIGCGLKTKPGVYTFISKYDEWIEKTIKLYV